MVKIGRDIYRTRAFQALGLVEVGPGPDVVTDDQLRAWVTDNVGSYYHFVGSCKMGMDRMAVVDSRLKVRGIEGLRIADGSVMPSIPAANTHTTIVMIGERAAEFIKNRSVRRDVRSRPDHGQNQEARHWIRLNSATSGW